MQKQTKNKCIHELACRAAFFLCVCLFSCSNCSRCRLHMHLTNHSLIMRKIWRPQSVPHAEIKKMAQVLGSPLYIFVFIICMIYQRPEEIFQYQWKYVAQFGCRFWFFFILIFFFSFYFLLFIVQGVGALSVLVYVVREQYLYIHDRVRFEKKGVSPLECLEGIFSKYFKIKYS